MGGREVKREGNPQTGHASHFINGEPGAKQKRGNREGTVKVLRSTLRLLPAGPEEAAGCAVWLGKDTGSIQVSPHTTGVHLAQDPFIEFHHFHSIILQIATKLEEMNLLDG